MAPHAALAEIGVDYELVRVERDADGNNTAAYLALNPWGRIPTLEDGELALTESAAILLHLGDRFPEATLVPAVGTRERSELYRWLLLLTNTLQPTLIRVIYPARFGESGVLEVASAEAHSEFDLIDAHLAVTRMARRRLAHSGRPLPLHADALRPSPRPTCVGPPEHRAHWQRTLALPGVRKMIDEQGLELPPFAS